MVNEREAKHEIWLAALHERRPLRVCPPNRRRRVGEVDHQGQDLLAAFGSKCREQGRTFLVIDTGEATVTVHGEEVGKLGPGDALGEMALIDKSARSATVTADSEVHAFQLPVWSFRPLIESHPEVVWAFLEAMARRVREAEARGTSGGS